ncbi:cyclic nucleotide-binding domain-containing protein (plasmid) [Ensifer sp. PDNC004]|uniref:cyclic nucleotide-binding domain-containing protein n=1 Tax=unclassified Ensifer TaxID=2633371 RepID=UPI00177F7501|nr:MULTISPECIES: cyclic nucleotide-binding domain-containing protein [unclassified Ensifer]MBD9650263.1 cyclic nucleotide-binding domain-containing protein [Ensifer sp. ENS09]QRY70612.1 cyclic nucleotide-binding domain-containing protein [Ensifer sp. PDNC004]
MRKVLYILGQLTDQDVEWLARAGERRLLPPGHLLINEGEAVPALFVLLTGELDVEIRGVGQVARLLPGEVVGEMSFIDRAPPSASVVTCGHVQVLSVSKAAIEAHIARDPAFGMRFYRALATFLSDRLRGTVRRLGYGSKSGSIADETADELDDAVLEGVSLAGERFTRMMDVLKG